MAQTADFFVIYTSADRAWAEWIAWQLETEGYKVVVQAWDFGPGRDWAHEMQQATSTAKRALLVLSGPYLTSAHGEAEWRTFYAQDPSGERGLLLPVRVGPVELPGLLKTRVYVDLVDQDAAGAQAALLAAARGARGKPAAEPEFPGGRRHARSAIEQPRFPGELPAVWNVPSHPNPFFTGRDLLLAEMNNRLNASEVTRRRVVLTGLGGVGKTQIAVEYAYLQRADYDLVWWARGEQLTSILGDYAALAGQPPLAVDLNLAEDTPQEVVVAAVRRWLERHRRWLLVLDNVDEPQTVADLLPRGTTGHVLLTSQAEAGWEPLADPLPVQVLAPTNAAGFLLARTRQMGPWAEAAATTLATTLGGLPLALEQAAAYVASTGTISLADYAELFGTRALTLLQRGQPLGYQHTVATTWSLALQRLQDTEPAAVDLLTLAAFLASDDLPQPLLAAHPSVLPAPLAAMAGDSLALADAVAALRRFSLVRVVGDGLYVHRLLQTVVRAALDAKTESAWVAAAVSLLRAGFPRPSTAVSTWAECERLLPHVLAVADHGRRLDVEHAGWLPLLNQAAVYLWSRGQYRQALGLQEEAVAGLRRILGGDHPSTLESMHDLAETRRAIGDPQGARRLFEQTLTTRQRVLGEDHPDTLTSMSNLAETRRNLGDLHGARELFELTLTTRRRVLGDDHPDTHQTMHGLAVTRRNLGDLRGARELHEQTLTTRRRMLGDDHPDTLQTMTSLAAIRRDLGDLQGARHLFEQTVAGYRRVLGDDHPNTLNAMNSIAVTRQALGDLEIARALHEEILTIRRRVLGDDDPETLWSMNNLAETLRSLGDLRGARDLHEQTLTTRRRVLGDDHPNTLTSMNNLAETRRLLGDLQGARQLHEQALARRRRALGDDHPNTLWSMHSLADTRRDLGDLQGARKLQEQILTIRRRMVSEDHPDTLWSMHSLAETRRDLGDLQSALQLHEETLSRRRRVLGDDHPDTLTSLNSLADLRRELAEP
jgi:tetratricopeptide (TPR) repeat protein